MTHPKKHEKRPIESLGTDGHSESAPLMKAAAYCRVSTNKSEQLDSLESQQRFFSEYADRNGFNLVKIYADEGKSGTKMKNRAELRRLLSDADCGMFEIVLIKDVSRLARNTVDFLTSVRKLKSLRIKVLFVNYDQTSSESSEFMLTMLSAIAQEESANTSKRVKFGKRLNAEKGRVPNLVYGYDKIPGDYFNLEINEKEAETVREIFKIYANREMGANRISMELNSRGITTKRGNKWSQNAITRILTNQIYIGRVINGKEEIEDFLTGKRRVTSIENRIVAERPGLRLVSDEIFGRAQNVMNSRSEAFKTTGERTSNRHVFSKLIKCGCCGSTFRRQVRSYKNTCVKWVCQGRNANGVESCPNKTVVGEEEMLNSIRGYFATILADKPNAVESVKREFRRKYKERNEYESSEKQLNLRIEKVEKSRIKYLEMYEKEIITMEELKQKSAEFNAEICRLRKELELIRANSSKCGGLESVLNTIFKDADSLVKPETLTNALLCRLIETISADERGNIEVYFKLLSPNGLVNDAQLQYNRT